MDHSRFVAPDKSQTGLVDCFGAFEDRSFPYLTQSIQRRFICRASVLYNRGALYVSRLLEIDAVAAQRRAYNLPENRMAYTRAGAAEATRGRGLALHVVGHGLCERSNDRKVEPPAST
jgi:hypothetical protein